MKTSVKANLCGIAATLLLSACGSSGFPNNPEQLGINPYPNRPGRAEMNAEKNFATLINNYAIGQPAQTPWVGYWWAYTSNGIANGKLTGGTSPAGKYDAARGVGSNGKRFDSQSWEVQHHGARVPGVEGWWGHCNGWCVAAALFPEPLVSKNYRGIEFSVGDLKALLTEGSMLASADFYGNRVDYGNEPQYKWDDVVPDQMFMVLTNYMGKLKMPVLIDRNTTTQVWNQPMAGYQYEYPTPDDYLGPSPEAPNVYRINLTGSIWWSEDGVGPSELTVPFKWQNDRHFSSRTLRMELWLDGPVVFDASGHVTSSGNLIVTRIPGTDGVLGGNWRNGGITSEAQPDYLWVPFSVLNPADPSMNNPKDDYANPQVDMDWVLTHLITGTPDESSTPIPVPTAPIPSSSPPPSDPERPNPQPQPPSNPVQPPDDSPVVPQPPAPRPPVPRPPAPQPPVPQPPVPQPPVPQPPTPQPRPSFRG